MADALDALKASLATSATGYAAVIDGVLNVCTVGPTPRAAAVNAMYLQGVVLVGGCQDPDCNCLAEAVETVRPNIRIVPVNVEAVG